ncbi:MAG: hypothetical protein LAN84_00240 [Acidobacteriia bacterium]|nr:hypothetical protein [Terriglobia bacterium]
MLDTITLDGRKFTGITQALTANQDDYILAHLRLAGAIEVLSDLDGVKRTKEKRAEDLLTQILLSGRTHHILAGCLTEDGKVWSREEANANAARFARITDIEEKTAMRSCIVRFIIGFFSLGEPSSEISPKSSSRSGRVPPIRNAAPSTSGTSRS